MLTLKVFTGSMKTPANIEQNTQFFFLILPKL